MPREKDMTGEKRDETRECSMESLPTLPPSQGVRNNLAFKPD